MKTIQLIASPASAITLVHQQGQRYAYKSMHQLLRLTASTHPYSSFFYGIGDHFYDYHPHYSYQAPDGLGSYSYQSTRHIASEWVIENASGQIVLKAVLDAAQAAFRAQERAKGIRGFQRSQSESLAQQKGSPVPGTGRSGRRIAIRQRFKVTAPFEGYQQQCWRLADEGEPKVRANTVIYTDRYDDYFDLPREDRSWKKFRSHQWKGPSAHHRSSRRSKRSSMRSQAWDDRMSCSCSYPEFFDEEHYDDGREF